MYVQNKCIYKYNVSEMYIYYREKRKWKTTFFEILEKYDEGEVKFADKYKILKPISADCN